MAVEDPLVFVLMASLACVDKGHLLEGTKCLDSLVNYSHVIGDGIIAQHTRSN